MTLLRWLLYGLLPAISAVLVFVGVGGPRLAAIGIATGIAVPFGLLVAWPDWPWDLDLTAATALPWLFWSVVGAGLLGTLHDLRWLPKMVVIPLEAVLVVMLPWILSAPLRPRWSFETALVRLSLAWAGLVVVWWVLRTAAERRPGRLVPAACVLFLAGDLWLVQSRNHDLSWQLLAAGVVALATALVVASWRRPFQLGTGAILVVVLLHGGMLMACRVYAGFAAKPMLLALLSPVPLWISVHKGFDESRRTGAAIGLTLSAVMYGLAAGVL